MNTMTLIAQAGSESLINAQSVPGTVGIPTWLLVTAIVTLCGALASMLLLFLRREKQKDEFWQGKCENQGKDFADKLVKISDSIDRAMEAKIKEHRDAFQDQTKFWQLQLDKANEENLGLGRKLDERHDESIKLLKETGESLKIVDLVIDQLRNQQHRGPGG